MKVVRPKLFLLDVRIISCFRHVVPSLKPFGGFLTRYKLQLNTQDPLALQETLPSPALRVTPGSCAWKPLASH